MNLSYCLPPCPWLSGPERTVNADQMSSILQRPSNVPRVRALDAVEMHILPPRRHDIISPLPPADQRPRASPPAHPTSGACDVGSFLGDRGAPLAAASPGGEPHAVGDRRLPDQLVLPGRQPQHARAGGDVLAGGIPALRDTVRVRRGGGVPDLRVGNAPVPAVQRPLVRRPGARAPPPRRNAHPGQRVAADGVDEPARVLGRPERRAAQQRPQGHRRRLLARRRRL